MTISELEAAHENELTALLERNIAQLCLKPGGFKLFVSKAWRYVEPGTPLAWNWHLDVMCEDLELVESGEETRQIFNIPPGTMKSLLVNVFFPAWCWAKRADRRFLTASYGNHLTIRDNLRLRNLILSDWYQTHYDVRLVDDQNAKQRFDTTARGWRIATSVNGVGTGEHPDIIVIDDPTSADQARSDVSRQAANDWFDRTISSRGISRDVAIIVVMQRLHEEDLTGHLLKKGGWKLTCFPMRFERTRKNEPEWTPDPRDPRTEPGELLWPSLFTEKKVRRLELDLGPYGTAGQLQQRPAPEGGGLFKREWFKFIPALPADIRRSCRGWDTASTEEGGDWTVGVRMHEREDETIVIDSVIRGQWSPEAVEKNMLAVAQGEPEVPQREEKEGGSAGVAVVAARAKLLKGFDYKGIRVTGDKVTRSKPFRAQVEAGNVFLLRTGDASRDAWIEPFIQELTGFPTGKHDDQVDGSSCSYNQLLLEEVREVEVTW